ncbi:laccase, multicopper oxidase, benzenediol:oxygen oxidorectuctase [Paramarasmius palmivorus]|uniref:Laccase, multicopper oxidase, benzenediol:oxygen oxidorectuctase n=1 Tax=Paramarasmius palmivorus TaxID=297713 RepID=A0AAW0D2Z3_9AGAR
MVLIKYPATQYCDGLRGPLIVYDEDDSHASLYDVDDESTVITLTDWYHEKAKTITSGATTPNSTLINGLGRYSAGNETTLAVVNVTQGTRQVGNVSATPSYSMQINPWETTVAMFLEFAFSDGIFTVNGVEYVPPTVPVLLQILSGAQTADSLLPSGSIISLPRNATVELSMTGGVNSEQHPMHLHGHTFSVVRAAGASDYNFVNPIRRDVVNAGDSTDNVTIRFTTDNPGPWIFHCHIDWHLEEGFAVVFAERTDEWNSTIHPTEQWDNLCPTYDALSSDDL